MKSPTPAHDRPSPWPLRLAAAGYGAWLAYLVVMAILQKMG